MHGVRIRRMPCLVSFVFWLNCDLCPLGVSACRPLCARLQLYSSMLQQLAVYSAVPVQLRLLRVLLGTTAVRLYHRED